MILLNKIRTIKTIFKSNGFFGILMVIVSKISERLLFSLALEFDEIMLMFILYKKNKVFTGKQDTKIMFDVGARFGSSLKPFANDGWNVFAFEPDSSNRKKLITEFDHYLNVNIDKRAISDKSIDKVEFYSSPVSTGISSLSNFHPSHVKSEEVKVTTIESFCDDEGIKMINFLKIDTEGYDFFALKGVPWNQISPSTIVCEFEDGKTESLGYNFHDMAKFLVNQGYDVIVSEWYPIIKYGGPHQWRGYEKYPCELTDENGWGNLIATNDKTIHKEILELCAKFKNRAFFWERFNMSFS